MIHIYLNLKLLLKFFAGNKCQHFDFKTCKIKVLYYSQNFNKMLTNIITKIFQMK